MTQLQRAGLLSVRVVDVTRSLITATTSSRFTTPVFWGDLATGINCNVQVQIPEARTQSLDDLRHVPVTSTSGMPVLLRHLAEIEPDMMVGAYERFFMVRLVSLTAHIKKTDFGTAVKAVRQVIADTGPAREEKRSRVAPLVPSRHRRGGSLCGITFN